MFGDSQEIIFSLLKKERQTKSQAQENIAKKKQENMKTVQKLF